LNNQRLSSSVSEALALGATLIVPSAQRQAAIRAAYAARQRDAGLRIWGTPRILTFPQFAEASLGAQWAARNIPDRLLPAGAEWAALRELRREAGGTAEARALLTSIRTLADWRIPARSIVPGLSAETDLLCEALASLDVLATRQQRRPLRAWLDELGVPEGALHVAGGSALAAAPRKTLERLGAGFETVAAPSTPVAIATADDDEHELELIAGWCRERLERNPRCRLLIVDAKLRQRRRAYERLLAQTLTPSEWISHAPRAGSAAFTIEGGRTLAEFPLVAHALLTLRLLTGRLRFDEVVHWLRLPFLDGPDVNANATLEALLRDGRKLEFSGEELATFLSRDSAGPIATAMATRLRAAVVSLKAARRASSDWAQFVPQALRQLDWPGSRPLRSDEQQTLARWHALLDEYSALGAWLPLADAREAVATLQDLAADRNFDPASVEAPVTLTESHDDPVVRYDGIWIAGLDAAQWPAAPRPDVFIPLALQVTAGIPWASAAAQTRAAHAALAGWRASTDALVCSWARLEGDAHRTPSPLLERIAARVTHELPARMISLAHALRRPELEAVEDVRGLAVDKSGPVPGGVRPLTLQAECGFRAYGEMRLAARELEAPAPGLDPRERGMLLHKALELVWQTLDGWVRLSMTDEQVRKPMIAQAVEAAVVAVFRGYVPLDLRPAVEREKLRLETLIEASFKLELKRPSFTVEAREALRHVSIAGGQFQVRIDRIDLIEGGGHAIIDYKSGDAYRLAWLEEKPREPQLIAYLLAERGRNIQALANLSLTQGRAKFSGKCSRKGLLPDLPGLNPAKVPGEEIELAWQDDIHRWVHGLQLLAADYLAGHAPVEPASDVCRKCHLTILCRRVELAAAPADEGEGDAHG
jgi:ATP-dependent helicase/nuclease subunit B